MREEKNSTKDMYVVKSKEGKTGGYQPREGGRLRDIYVIKTSEETLGKYSNIVKEFARRKGAFVSIGDNKMFHKNLKRCLVNEIGISSEALHIVLEPSQATARLGKCTRKGFFPFIFLEYITRDKSNLKTLVSIRAEYPKAPIIMITGRIDKEHLLLFHEEGATHTLNKSASVNEIIRTIVHILKPQTAVDELAGIGYRLIDDERYEDAIRVANTILEKQAFNARAYVILGDAYKGMARRQAAMREYRKAEKHSEMFIDPLKRIFTMYSEENNKDGMVEYLVKLDNLSPLNFNRKIKIGDLNYDMGKVDKAEEYYDRAIDFAIKEADAIVGEMSLDIAERLSGSNPELAEKYFRKSLDLIKESRSISSMNTFNRLGISLRKSGLWEDAVEAYKSAERISPGDENIQYNLSMAYYQGKQYEEALNHMYMALKMNPKIHEGNAEVAYNIGAVFHSGGNMSQAKRMVRYALEIEPDHKRALALGIV